MNLMSVCARADLDPKEVESRLLQWCDQGWLEYRGMGRDMLDEQLWQRLRAWRLEQARSQGVSPYFILQRATLRRIAALRPADLDELASIKGIGPSKLEKYGQEVLALLEEWKAARNSSTTQPPSNERSRPDHGG